jgi:phosphoribosyl 1,2-cyclic phosphodiesterase
MQFASLGSGSRGNATLIEAGSTLVMVDCGFSCRETERRMARLDRSPEQLSAVLVTHEHGDHIRGVAVLARKYRLPVWLTRGTHLVMQDDNSLELHYIDGHHSRGLGELEVHPYTVPHDAREPCQFAFSDGVRRFGMLTDTGRITAHIRESLHACDALLLECNHECWRMVRTPAASRRASAVRWGTSATARQPACSRRSTPRVCSISWRPTSASRTTSRTWPARPSPVRWIARLSGSVLPGRRPALTGV